MATQRKYKRENELLIDALGPCKIHSPLDRGGGRVSFVGDDDRILLNLFADDAFNRCRNGIEPPSFELAGPRKKIYFDPAKTKAAVVTCGGLCPGINSVVRAIVLELHHSYGVRNILGVKYGFQGFIPSYGHEVVELTPSLVTDIHGRGGAFLGMSRGPQNIDQIVDALERLNISILFTIGGDGTLRASLKIKNEISERGLKTAVIGIPKTIDNDITFVSKTFGFDTAVGAATEAIRSAHNEAISVPNGIGLVKVMGRYAGFVATNATLGLPEVNFCLIPEVSFDLEGPKGLLTKLTRRIRERGHAVILVAEGAGQELFKDKPQFKDASGNVQFQDIGQYLKDRILEHAKREGLEITLKYIDPSYMIRSLSANAVDRIFCGFLGQNAVHAGMAGKTGMLVSKWNYNLVHVPFDMATTRQKFVDTKSSLWRSVLESTGQGSMVNGEEG